MTDTIRYHECRGVMDERAQIAERIFALSRNTFECLEESWLLNAGKFQSFWLHQKDLDPPRVIPNL